MADIWLDLRRRIVRAYLGGLTISYEATAVLFGVGRASVSRLLRRERETGDVLPKPRGGDLRSCVDLAWLKAHAEQHPDHRLVDRMAAWQQHSGRKVSIGAMCNALQAIEWTHKKRRRSRSNETARRCKQGGTSSRPRKPSSR